MLLKFLYLTKAQTEMALNSHKRTILYRNMGRTTENISAMVGWITEEELTILKEISFNELTEIEIRNITTKLHRWKSLGVDKIHSFWYKRLLITNKSLAKHLPNILLKLPNLHSTKIHIFCKSISIQTNNMSQLYIKM